MEERERRQRKTREGGGEIANPKNLSIKREGCECLGESKVTSTNVFGNSPLLIFHIKFGVSISALFPSEHPFRKFSKLFCLAFK